MYYRIKEKLADAGFEQYEISSFSRHKQESRHNLKYWRLQDYLGVGLGASGNVGLERYDNHRNFDHYYAAIDKRELPKRERLFATMEEREREFIMLNMRLLRGFSIQEINTRFGIDFLTKYAQAIEKHERLNTIQVSGDNIRFTDYGLDVGNQFYLDIM